jgi:hypothetical protein
VKKKKDEEKKKKGGRAKRKEEREKHWKMQRQVREEEEESSIDEDDEDDDNEGNYPYDWLDSMAKEGGTARGVIPLDRGADAAGSTAMPRTRGSRPWGSYGNGGRRRAPEATEFGPPPRDGGILTPGDSGVATATPSAQHG